MHTPHTLYTENYNIWYLVLQCQEYSSTTLPRYVPSCMNIHIYITLLLWTTVTSLKATLQLKAGYDKAHTPLKVNFIYIAPLYLTGHIVYRVLGQVEIITERKWLETDHQPSVYLPQTINQFISTHAERKSTQTGKWYVNPS